ncbi:MAG: hemolysin family protein [Nitrospirae bacterium]|nr:hemolysin family protein [Nitrospirota bacterium]
MLFLEILIIILLILLNGYFSASEISLISLRKSRVRHLVKSGNPKARKIQKLQEEPERFLATIQIGVTLIGTLAATFGGVIAIERIKPFIASLPVEFISKTAEPMAVFLVVGIITYLTLVFGELVPKSLAIRYSEKIAFITATPIDILSRLIRWILRILTVSNNFVLGLFVASDHHEPSLVSEDEVKYLIREGRKSGVFEPSEEDLIHSVFRFTDTVVKEVMVPRTEIVALEAESDVDAILRTMNEKGFSRLPVYSETIDNVIGVVYLKDILALHMENRPFKLDQVIRKPYIVPPNKNVSVLLKEMREKRIHLALVGDEYGGTDGLVTMEDLIEEIVGDIQDEQDKVLREIDEIAANRYLVDGKTNIEKVNERLNVNLPEDEFETIGGFVLGIFGRLPAEGDQVRYQNLMFTVLRLRKNRISRIRVLKYAPDQKEGEDNEDAVDSRD